MLIKPVLTNENDVKQLKLGTDAANRNEHHLPDLEAASGPKVGQDQINVVRLTHFDTPLF